jgi:hypothetical protein
VRKLPATGRFLFSDVCPAQTALRNFAVRKKKQRDMTFDEIKQGLKDYCRERNVCADGYADLLRAESPADLWAILKQHIIGMQSDLLCDYVAQHAEHWYAEYGAEARHEGIMVGSQERGMMVLVCNKPDYRATEEADYYVFGTTRITASGRAVVHCRMAAADVVLAGSSKGLLERCSALVTERATATLTDCRRAECRDAATVRLMSGTLTDHGHLAITAYNGSTVYSISTKKITLVAGATVKLLEE